MTSQEDKTENQTLQPVQLSAQEYKHALTWDGEFRFQLLLTLQSIDESLKKISINQ